MKALKSENDTPSPLYLRPSPQALRPSDPHTLTPADTLTTHTLTPSPWVKAQESENEWVRQEVGLLEAALGEATREAEAHEASLVGKIELYWGGSASTPFFVLTDTMLSPVLVWAILVNILLAGGTADRYAPNAAFVPYFCPEHQL